MTDSDDVIVEVLPDEWWCWVHKTHHHRHHRHAHSVEVITAATDPRTGVITMSDTTPITLGLDPTPLTIALGPVSDTDGHVIPGATIDPGSVTFAASDTTLATIDTQDPNAGTATATTSGTAGTFTIGVNATVGGVPVTGTSVPLIAAPGQPATVEVDVTVG